MADTADAALLAAKRELNSLLIELDAVWPKWPQGRNVIARLN